MPRKLKQYSVEWKVNVVEWHRQNGHNVSQTAREFSIDRKRVREWNSCYDNLLLNNVGSSSRAWENVKEESITNSFLTCGISNKLDGTEDDLVSDNFPALDEDNLRGELGDILFESDDSDLEFDGFDEQDL